MKTDNKIIDGGGMLFWEMEVDLNNDKTMDNLLAVALLGKNDEKTNRCTDFISKNMIHLKDSQFDGRWGGIVESSTPFVFAGKTYIAYGTTAVSFSVAEVYPDGRKHASPSTLSKNFICEFKNLNYGKSGD